MSEYYEKQRDICWALSRLGMSRYFAISKEYEILHVGGLVLVGCWLVLVLANKTKDCFAYVGLYEDSSL
jgi:hypothetical protein